MFQFLKSNASISLLFILIIWVISTLVFVQWNIPPYVWELKNFLIGQKLNEGFRMYQDIRDNTGPLSVGIFQLLDTFHFPITWNPYLAMGIVIFQAYIFQQTCKQFDLMPDLGNVPFFIYALFFHFSLDFLIPSAALMGLTFLLLAWREIIKQQSTLQVDDGVFLLGIYIAAAALCYPSYFYFLFWGFLSLAFYSGVQIRQLLLVLVGFLLTLLITGLIYGYHGNLPYLIQLFKQSALVFKKPNIDQLSHVAWAYVPAFSLGIYGLWTLISNPKIRSNGQKAQQTNLIWIFTSFIALFTIPATESNNFIFFMPAFAYYTLNLFFVLKKYWIKELLLLTIMGITWISLQHDWNAYDTNRVTNGKLPFKNEKLMVLGPEIAEYQQNSMAGPFVNWELAEPLFADLNQYGTIVVLDHYFSLDPPTYIYDTSGKFKSVRAYLPYLNNQYTEIAPQLYKRKN